MVQKTQYLKIQSKLNVNITSGLDHLDMTDVNANVGDKLKVQALWAKQIVRIKAGVSYYPVEIKDWNTTKALVRGDMITLGEIVEFLPDELNEEEKAFIMSNFVNLNEGKEEAKRQKEDLGKVKQKSKGKSAPKLDDLELD